MVGNTAFDISDQSEGVDLKNQMWNKITLRMENNEGKTIRLLMDSQWIYSEVNISF